MHTTENGHTDGTLEGSSPTGDEILLHKNVSMPVENVFKTEPLLSSGDSDNESAEFGVRQDMVGRAQIMA